MSDHISNNRSGEWRDLILGEVCTKIGSGATPRGGKKTYLLEGPFALIRSQNVYNHGFHREGLAFISDNQADDLSNVEVLQEDVLLNITGDSVARVCQVDSAVLPARVNQHVAIVRADPAKLDARFLRYYLVSPYVQAMLLSWADSGSTRKALTKKMIESLEVSAPADVSEQRAIAHILGTLDDKIELNRRMNQTLEEMARAIYKDWFVDFGPVRAKLEGREPYLPPELWDLFPDQLVDSELGEVPEGWEVKALGELIADVIGGDWGKGLPDSANTEMVSIIRGTDIPELRNGGFKSVPLRYTTVKKLQRRRLQAGDIVIEVSGGSPTQSTGRSLLITESILERFSTPVVCASFSRRLRPNNLIEGIIAAQHLGNI